MYNRTVCQHQACVCMHAYSHILPFALWAAGPHENRATSLDRMFEGRGNAKSGGQQSVHNQSTGSCELVIIIIVSRAF